MGVEGRVKRLRKALKELEARKGPDCWFEGEHWLSRKKCIMHIRSMLPPEPPAPKADKEARDNGPKQ